MPGTKQSSFNVYQSITDSIIAAIEAGTGPVEMPWYSSADANGLPHNAATGNGYRGVNILSLWVAAARLGFSTPLWATYRQWSGLGAQVRRGEKGSVIVFYKQIEAGKDADQTDEPDRPSTRLLARASWVFNADQVDGYTLPERPPADPVAAIERADAFVAGTGAVIHHGAASAFYSVGADLIQMPDRAAFIGTKTSTPTESWYGVLFHELVHWSGAEHRLARDLYNRFGSDAYAMEELVAELGAAFLSAEFSISPSPRADHAAYIDNWCDVLKADNRAIFSAASKAAEALDYLLKFAQTEGHNGETIADTASIEAG